LATLLNYFCLLFVQSIDSWLNFQRAILYINIATGVAFLTILLLGAIGALGTFLALTLQYAQLYNSNDWLVFVSYASASIALQYAMIKVCLYVLGLAPRLHGLSHYHLLVLSVIFSVTYTLSTTFILQELPHVPPRTLAQAGVADWMGIITCFALLKLLGVLRKQFYPPPPPPSLNNLQSHCVSSKQQHGNHKDMK
jgi:fluoride ion exporter CrcB/FEX